MDWGGVALKSPFNILRLSDRIILKEEHILMLA